MSGRRLISRRAALLSGGALVAAASGLGVYTWLGNRGEIDPALEALQRASRTPGPAAARLQTIVPRHTVRPLPFGPDSIPGFSPATHHLHHAHHYLEYFWRWESGERNMLRMAVDVARDRSLVASLQPRFRNIAEETREAANMVLLHQIHWSHFGQGGEVSSDDRSDADRIEALAGDADWLLLVDAGNGPAVHVAGRVRGTTFDEACEVLDGVDLPEHAWRLDFPDRPAYIRRWLANLPAAIRDRWHAALRHPPVDLPARSHRPDDDEATLGAIGRIIAGHETADDRPEAGDAWLGLRLLAGGGGRIEIVETGEIAVDDLIMVDHPAAPTGLVNARLLATIAGTATG